jgi:hypothetical protein
MTPFGDMSIRKLHIYPGRSTESAWKPSADDSSLAAVEAHKMLANEHLQQAAGSYRQRMMKRQSTMDQSRELPREGEAEEEIASGVRKTIAHTLARILANEGCTDQPSAVRDWALGV